MRRPRTTATALAAPTLGIALWVAAALGGCAPDEPAAADFRAALPDEELLLFALPTETGVTTGELSVTPAGLVGGGSRLYQVTRDTRRTVNAALRELLEPLVAVARRTRPTTRGEDVWIWRVSPAGDQDRHVLIIRRAADGHFAFSAWSRDRQRPLARWRFRAYGTTTPSGEGRGRGAIWVNLDNDRKPATAGKVLAFWERVGGRREVSVGLYDASPDAERIPRRTRGYLFVDGPAGGLMLYGPEAIDIHQRPDKAAAEAVTLLSRWTHDGVGRTDVTARGGDVADDGLAALVRSECWSAPDFTVTYEATHVIRRVGAGLEEVTASGELGACPPVAVEVAVAPELVDEPQEPDPPRELEDSEPTD